MEWRIIMGQNTILPEKERNLLLYSNYIHTDEGFNDLIALLKEHPKVKLTDIVTKSDLTNRIINNHHIWLDRSRAEWNYRKINPVVTNKELLRKKWKKCALCGEPTRIEHYIINKHNQREINVGGECIKQFMGKEIGYLSDKILKNPSAAVKYERLVNEYPEIRNILFNDKDFLSRTKLILPTSYCTSYKKIHKKITGQLNNYFNNDLVEVNTMELERNIRIYNNVKESFETYYKKNEGDFAYLSRDIINLVANQQKEIYSELVQTMQNNNGKITKDIASKIKVESFLVAFSEAIPKFYSEDFMIEKCKTGLIDITIYDHQLPLNFTISSSIFIDFFGGFIDRDNKKRKLKHFCKINYSSLQTRDTKTNEIIKNKAIDLLNSQGYTSNYELSYRDIYGISPEKDPQFDRKKYRLENLLDNLSIFRVSSDQKLHVWTSSQLLKSGKELVLNNDEVTKREVLKKLLKDTNLFDQKDLYTYINNELELKK